MAQLTGEPLKFAAEHMTNCRKHGYKKYRVLVSADSNTDGKTLCTYLQQVYKPSGIADYSGGYRDFSLVFDTVSRRDEVVNDINDAVTAYRMAHPGSAPTNGGSSTVYTSEEPVDVQTNKTGWTTYLIIGAAAVAIIMLLWNRKKKK
ncbi:MAG: hypothetical protein IKM99_09125 [Bacteroidales bacterium]|nr:hypothetical protein [Bacteroidales bacterium]